MLNSFLPAWMDQAMAEYPWTLPVNIVTGGGSQVPAEVVEHWIGQNVHVANRFM